MWGKLWGKNKKHQKVLDLLDNLAEAQSDGSIPIELQQKIIIITNHIVNTNQTLVSSNKLA